MKYVFDFFKKTLIFTHEIREFFFQTWKWDLNFCKWDSINVYFKKNPMVLKEKQTERKHKQMICNRMFYD